MTVSVKAPTSTTGSIQLNGSDVLTIDSSGNVTAPNKLISTGHVLQVVNATYATVDSTTSSSYVDTGLSLSITPSSASNKILILVNINGLYSSSATVGQFAIANASNTTLLEFEGLTGYSLAAGDSYGETGTNYLHSPSTTSSYTYKIRFRNVAGTGISINQKTTGVSTSTITLLEVAG